MNLPLKDQQYHRHLPYKTEKVIVLFHYVIPIDENTRPLYKKPDIILPGTLISLINNQNLPK